MSKPINAKTEGCSPTSSNCVIWQGPDIKCLNLCKGDTVSDVIFQLGCLLCNLKDELDVDNYDLTCFDLAKCDLPTSFIEFIQIVIDKLCNLESQLGTPEAEAIAEQILIVAACFTAELGNSATISNYVTAIGQKLCEQEVIIQNQQVAIQDLLNKIEELENIVNP
jgi:hypothetical protein